jgi:hypothetical protein
MQKPWRTCKDVTRLVLQSQDRPLGGWESVSLRLHWMMCHGCRRFRDQQRFMQQALGRWRAYSDNADQPPQDPR